MEFVLITGRTVDQGYGKEFGKFSQEYLMNVAVCEMHPEDMRKLNIRDGKNVRVTTEVGSVVVKARESRRIRKPGIIFIPYGPWANAIMKPETEGTGMPHFKGIKARVELTDEEVLDLKSLLMRNYGCFKEENI